MAIRTSALPIALAVAIAAALAFVACSGDTDDIEERLVAVEVEVAEMRGIVASLDETLRTANLIAAMGTLAQVGFHHIDVTVQGYTELDREFLATLRNARRVVQTAAWPHALQPGADALAAAIEQAEAAYEEEDLAALKAAALASHDRFHALESQVNDLMAGGKSESHGESGEHHG